MFRACLLSLTTAVLLAACPKAPPPPSLTGTDDEKMDTIAAQLEEFRTRTDVKCPDWCSAKPRVCDLSKLACEIAGKATDRNDFQKKCLATSEECARFSDGCATCK